MHVCVFTPAVLMVKKNVLYYFKAKKIWFRRTNLITTIAQITAFKI
jgi:hypothetical protein